MKYQIILISLILATAYADYTVPTSVLTFASKTDSQGVYSTVNATGLNGVVAKTSVYNSGTFGILPSNQTNSILIFGNEEVYWTIRQFNYLTLDISTVGIFKYQNYQSFGFDYQSFGYEPLLQTVMNIAYIDSKVLHFVTWDFKNELLQLTPLTFGYNTENAIGLYQAGTGIYTMAYAFGNYNGAGVSTYNVFNKQLSQKYTLKGFEYQPFYSIFYGQLGDIFGVEIEYYTFNNNCTYTLYRLDLDSSSMTATATTVYKLQSLAYNVEEQSIPYAAGPNFITFFSTEDGKTMTSTTVNLYVPSDVYTTTSPTFFNYDVSHVYLISQ